MKGRTTPWSEESGQVKTVFPGIAGGGGGTGVHVLCVAVRGAAGHSAGNGLGYGRMGGYMRRLIASRDDRDWPRIVEDRIRPLSGGVRLDAIGAANALDPVKGPESWGSQDHVWPSQHGFARPDTTALRACHLQRSGRFFVPARNSRWVGSELRVVGLRARQATDPVGTPEAKP